MARGGEQHSLNTLENAKTLPCIVISDGTWNSPAASVTIRILLYILYSFINIWNVRFTILEFKKNLFTAIECDFPDSSIIEDVCRTNSKI